ncbi:MAG: putative nucleotidyltransferase substrate binding domain-containing protein [Solirubrobacterales bacterium]
MHDIAEFLSDRDPFGSLRRDELERLAERVEVEFFADGATVFGQGEPAPGAIWVIRRGSVELLDAGRVVDLLGEGEVFGHPSMLSGLPTDVAARAAEDTLCYRIAAAEAAPLFAKPAGLGMLARSLAGRARGGGAGTDPLGLGRTASSLVRARASFCEPELTIREAARRMVAEGTGALLVRGEGADGLGILTDRDIRARVVARGASADDPVRAVMTAPVISVDAGADAAEVMLTMLDNDIHHVPVVSGPDILGVIEEIDLLTAGQRSPFVLRRAIAQAPGKAELAELAGRLREGVLALHGAGLPPEQVSETISVVADALIRRMIELAIAANGDPPVEFAWVALGSHGRREPVPSSDVDSGLAWSDPGPGGEAAAEASLKAIAADVTDTVEVLGWKLDAHGVTAAGVFAAHSISDWRRIIPNWLSKPDDERVLIATSVLLDGRVIRGPEELDPCAVLHDHAQDAALLRWMLRLALASKPPTGFLRDLVLAASGERDKALDVKHAGLMPVVDLARYAALVAGSRARSTPERLRDAASAGSLDDHDARVLAEAYALFAEMRLNHQVERLRAGSEPDDLLDPHELNALERRYLREAFREVSAVQKGLARKLDRPFG